MQAPKPIKTSYYNWSDLQAFFKDRLKISNDEFLVYQKLWFDLHYGAISNGSIVNTDLDYMMDELEKWVERKPWIKDFIKALEELYETVDEPVIAISYAW